MTVEPSTGARHTPHERRTGLGRARVHRLVHRTVPRFRSVREVLQSLSKPEPDAEVPFLAVVAVTDIDWSYMYAGLATEDNEDGRSEDIPAQVGNEIEDITDYAPIYIFDFESEYPQCATCKGPNLSRYSDHCILCRIAID